MDLYLDKPNLYSLIGAKEKTEHDVYSECERLLRRNMHLIFNFNRESCEADALLLPWFLNRAVSGRGISEETDEYRSEKFPQRPIKNNFRNNMEWRIFTSMFMLDDEKIEGLKGTNSMLIGGVGEEVPLLCRLFCDGSFDLHSIYNIQDKTTFPNWRQLLQDGHIMPCSDIIIADRYLWDASKSVLDKNLYALLRLFAEMKNEKKVNIVFFTDEVNEEKRKEVKKDIESMFGKKSGTNITFVQFNNDRPHDRFILTNYRLFRSGDSFNNYFDEHGNLKTKGLTLDVDSIANQNVGSVIEVIRTWFQNICTKNRDRISGDKVSNFIDFTK